MSGHLKKLRVVDPVLSKLAQGYSNAQFIGNNVLKVVPMAKEAGEVPTFGDEAFVIEDSERGVGGQRKRIKTNPANMTPVVLHEHSLEDVVDDREKEEAFYNIAQRKQRVVQNKLGLELEV